MIDAPRLSLTLLVSAALLLGCGEEEMSINNNSIKKNRTEAKKILEISAGPFDVPLVNQMDEPRLYNGCEITSLAMLLNYHGYETTKSELAKKMPRVPLTYDNGLKGNPNKGFVGDMIDGPGLTVYHGPIHTLAKKYAGNKAIDLTGESIETLFQFVSQGNPVWVITTINHKPVNDFRTWDTPSGEVEVTFSVHSVVVTGFNKEYVYLNNPYGLKNQKVDKRSFKEAWEQMGSQAVVIKENTVSSPVRIGNLME